MAHSLHEVAKLIEQPDELIPIFNLLIKDNQDIREGIVENLPVFVSRLTERDKFVEQISDILTKKELKWRDRV